MKIIKKYLDWFSEPEEEYTTTEKIILVILSILNLGGLLEFIGVDWLGIFH